MDQFHEAIATIKADNRSGSQGVLNQTLAAVEGFLKRQKSSDGETRDTLIKGLQSVLKVHFPYMALRHFVNEIFLVIEEEGDHDVILDKLSRFVKDYYNKWCNVNQVIAENAFNHLNFNGKTIFLHSNSGTLISLFNKIRDHCKDVKVIQTECRPQLEGRSQAKALADLGFPVKLIVDAAAPKYVRESDMVLVGSDAILGDNFINKVGSMGISLSSEKYGIPYYVLADSRKIVNDPDYPDWIEYPKPSDEVWEKPGNNNITPENFYFEAVPNELVTAFITEESRFIGEEIDKFVRPLKKSRGIIEVI